MCLAPGLASHIAGLLRGDSPALSLDPYSPDRFDSGRELALESLWNGASTFTATAGGTG